MLTWAGLPSPHSSSTFSRELSLDLQASAHLFCCLTVPHICHPLSLCCRYLGDGRFHLESVMIANPGVPAYRYGLSWADQLGRGWDIPATEALNWSKLPHSLAP